MTTGRKAIFGIGKPTEMIGSKNQWVNRLREIPMPSAMPATAPIKKPVKAR
jgi:hypothetical protein